MIILGGSPLGLVGVTTDSRKTTSNKIQYSTFNAGKSRNVNVYQYNSGDGGGQPSLFTGRRKIRPWPNIKMVNVDNASVPDPLGLGDIEKETLYKTQGRKGDSYSRKDLHNNDVYDTSITHLIDKLANTKASLRPADFAYLKDLGVYPNNRLMIARRFLGPIDDNIMVNSGGDVGSLATIVSWMPESEDLFSINFGEVWGEADASFSGIIDGIGNDFKMKGLGEIMGGAGGVIPLPGFTEILQRQLMAKMGIISAENANTIPSGNPNLIKEAKVRKTIGYDEPGSGLMGKLSFKVTAEYEMKFISGLDPTIVWMDIISNILRFGTSTSINWGLNKSFAAKMKQWINNPGALLNELGSKIKTAVSDASKLIVEESKKLISAFEGEQRSQATEESKNEDGDEDESEENIEAFIKSAKKAYSSTINKVIRGLKSVLNGVVSKYKVKAIGVFNALTGSPSTPWHLTIGNPLRPIFCCGDMLTQNVTLTMGSQLAFNDLPSSIKVEFELTNARNLGLQEIMSKFNSGYLRTVDVQKSFYETNTYQVGDKTFYESPGFYEYENPLGDNVTTTISADGTPVVASSELASSDGAETVVVEEEKPVKDKSDREKSNDWYGWDGKNGKPYEGMENDLGKEAKKKWDSMKEKKEKKEAVVPKAKAANNGKDKKSNAKAKDKSSKKP